MVLSGGTVFAGVTVFWGASGFWMPSFSRILLNILISTPFNLCMGFENGRSISQLLA
jgi:hypothetical protein